MAWQDNVKKSIAAQCLAAWRAAGNAPGRRHKPYRVPDLAAAMVDDLNRDDEAEGKRLPLIYRTGALSLI